MHKLTAILGLLVLTLTGCATIVPQVSVEETGGRLPAHSGVVVAETVTNSERIAGPLGQWNELVFWKDGIGAEDHTYRLRALGVSQDTQRYVGILPAGTYRVGLLWATHRIVDTEYWAKAPVPVALGSFEVKAGAVTHLGTLVYQPFEALSVNVKTLPDYAVTRTGNEGLWEELKPLFPGLAGQIKNASPGNAWLADAHSALREVALARIDEARFPTRVYRLDGDLLITGKLGSVKDLGSGVMLDFTRKTISDMDTLDEDTWLIGGEAGLLAAATKDGRQARAIDGLTADEQVINVARMAKGLAAVLTQRGQDYHVYAYDGATDRLTHAATLNKDPTRVFAASAPPLMTVSANKISLYLNKLRYDVDLGSASLTQTDAYEFNRLSIQPDGTLIGLPYIFLGQAQYPVYSLDNGATWARLEGRATAHRPHYRFQDGRILNTDSDAEFKLLKGGYVERDEIPVLMSSDNGLTWVAISQLPKTCLSITPEASTDEDILALCENGNVMHSTDAGAHWTPLRGQGLPRAEAFPQALIYRYPKERGDMNDEGRIFSNDIN